MSKISSKYFRKTRNLHLFFAGCILISIVFYLLPIPDCLKWTQWFRENNGFDVQEKEPNMEYLNSVVKEHHEKSKFPYRYLTNEHGEGVPIVRVSAFLRLPGRESSSGRPPRYRGRHSAPWSCRPF